VPVSVPILGIYKKFFMPKFDYDECDVVFSITGYTNIKTVKPLYIYDQNNLGLELQDKVTSMKYTKGFWKWYYKPYKFLTKFIKLPPNAQYIANSIYSADNLAQNVKGAINVIYPPVDTSKYHISQKKKQVCMLCRISPEKNLEFAIEVLNKIQAPCVIIGAVTNMTMPYFNRLQEMCEKHVIISPNISRNNLEHILSESKVFFHTAPETFGISVVEGIASGCIPIVPDNSAHNETVPMDELRYTPDVIDDAVNHINNALHSNYDHRIDALLKHIDKFDIKKFDEEIVKLFE
jgi:glycosyltransferase involved in cell wall biosynthesis